MIKILIHSNSKDTKDGSKSPKNYPHFNELILKIKNNFEKIEINQIGTNDDEKLKNIDNYFFNIKLNEIKNLINEHCIWISIDSFLPHYCNCYNLKSGIVIFTISNPDVFGYPQNINLIKDKRNIRKKLFEYYKKDDYNGNSFIDYNIIYDKIEEKLND